MKNNGFLKHKTFCFISLLFAFFVFLSFSLPSCSTSKKYGQTNHQKTSYKHVKVKQPRWNTATSTSTTYYIKKQKQPKRYNP